MRINGKPVSIGLGSYPVVTLAEARKAALENRRALSMGHDPRRSIPTLAQSSERVLAVHSANWKDSGRTEQIWRAGMRDYVMPQLARARRQHHHSRSDVSAVAALVIEARDHEPHQAEIVPDLPLEHRPGLPH